MIVVIGNVRNVLHIVVHETGTLSSGPQCRGFEIFLSLLVGYFGIIEIDYFHDHLNKNIVISFLLLNWKVSKLILRPQLCCSHHCWIGSISCSLRPTSKPLGITSTLAARLNLRAASTQNIRFMPSASQIWSRLVHFGNTKHDSWTRECHGTCFGSVPCTM